MNNRIGQKTPKERILKTYKYSELQQQEQILNNQEQQMNQVHATVRNLKEIGQIMGQEIDDQTRLLEQVEDQVDSTQSRLQDGLRRMKTFINHNSDTKQQVTIVILIVILTSLAIFLLVA
jgi:t-SNARE complex subunit (syntaxin)